MHLLKCTVVVVFLVTLCLTRVSSISIEKNAYKGITISLPKSVHEEIVKKLKAVLTRSSELLYHATRRRSSFGEFVLSLPNSFSGELGGCAVATASPAKVDVHIVDGDWTEGTGLVAKHSRGCGEEGDVIRMHAHWLRGETEDLARQFVKQWSIYRYGVFDEDPIEEGSCHMSGDSWSPVGCYNVKVKAEAKLQNGVPVCFLPTNFFENKELKSSLMSQSNSTEILNFCDDSDEYFHNPSLPTLQNNLCKGRNVWSVIEESEDFKYGRNSALKSSTPLNKPVFKCFKEPPIQVTFSIQNSTTVDLSTAMVELGYSLFRFLGNMVPSNTKSNIVMFSDSEDNSQPVDLDLTNLNKLEAVITKQVKTFKVVSSTCLWCGFEKALNASLANPHPSPIVVLIAWESSLATEMPSKLTEIVRNFSPNVRLHLILVEDTASEVLSPPLVDAVRTTGGNIFSLPKEFVLMATKLQVILAGVVKNHLQVEDSTVVVHESTYSNIKDHFLDSFSIPSSLVLDKLVYNMYCDPGLPINEKNPNCTSERTAPTTFKCGQVEGHMDEVASPRIWKYPFEYTGGTKLSNCSSVAMLRVSPSSKRTTTFRGWLSKYQINNGLDGLVIYAETVGSSDQRTAVFATVSGSALQSPVTIELLDNGNGDPDVKAGDGIYSRYFTSFKKTGTYVVSISAEVWNGDDNFMTAEEVPRFVQKKIIGSFSVNEDAPDVDILPPNRVADLRVLSVDHENGTVTLQWTAPGNDYDFGTANTYEVFFTEDWKDLQDSMLQKIPPKKLYSPDIHFPKPSGETEQGTFQLPSNDSKIKTYYIALRAVDESQNKGKISNSVQVVIGIQNETAEDIDITDNETSTESMDDTNHGMSDFNKMYAILGGSAAVILLILIINVLIWGICFKKYKNRWKGSQSILDDGSREVELEDKGKVSHHSYTNPIMEGCTNVRNGAPEDEVVRRSYTNPIIEGYTNARNGAQEDEVVRHSYTNPIKEGYTNARNGAQEEEVVRRSYTNPIKEGYNNVRNAAQEEEVVRRSYTNPIKEGYTNARNGVQEDEAVVRRSYTNPIKEGYNNVRNGDEGRSDSLEYAGVIKRDAQRMKQVGRQDNSRHNERDLGLV